MIREGYIRLNLDQAGQVVLIVDGSESADAVWHRISEAASFLLQKLPGSRVALYFLGNSKRYSTSEFPSKATRWRLENIRRGSFITPVLSEISSHASNRIVVIGNGEVYDLHDWKGSPFWNQLLLVNAGRALGENVADERELSSPAELLSELHDSHHSVKITGPGFMPYWWDRDEYAFRIDEGNAALEASGPDNLSVEMSCFAREAEAVITGESGAESIFLTMEQGEMPATPWRSLSPREQSVFMNAVQGKPYNCPICNGVHDPSILTCEESERCLLGEIVYPSLEGKNGFFILTPDEHGHVLFRHHPRCVLRLDMGKVAILENGQPAVYSHHAGRWQIEGKLSNYHSIDHKQYILAV